MKIDQIESEMQRLAQAKITGKDADVVRQLKTSLFYARVLVVLAMLAIVLKSIRMLVDLAELPYAKGEFLLSQCMPAMILIAAYGLARLILSNLYLKHGERDFEVEVVER